MSAIIVEGLSKRYVIGHQRADTLRDTLSRGARGLLTRWRRGGRAAQEDFWALRDISFSIARGEVVGIIGRNGAGKSTLLKVLSRITEPTQGRVRLRGRVASLLEVGTGFHPELTGRENIFLNGAILGMARDEIRARFDEIVAFAEIERFLDTPVKHYSSGMYVRLAFAVAAHLEPEILIVDEVLAVGDQQFQNKCLGKMQSVARDSGRTVLFVSHNLAVVQALCRRCLLLDRGTLARDAAPGEAVRNYLEDGGRERWRRERPIPRSCGIVELAVRLSPDAPAGPEMEIEAVIESKVAQSVSFEVFLHDAFGQNLAVGALGNLIGTPPVALRPGRQTVRSAFPLGSFANGHYRLSFKLTTPFVENHDEVANAIAFDVELPPPAGASHRLLQSWGHGSFLLPLRPLPAPGDAPR